MELERDQGDELEHDNEEHPASSYRLERLLVAYVLLRFYIIIFVGKGLDRFKIL
jgi:hypothetical protein